MKIAVNNQITAEFDTETVTQACEVIKHVKGIHGAYRSDKVLEALLAVLLFRAMERQEPGAMDKLIDSLRS